MIAFLEFAKRYCVVPKYCLVLWPSTVFLLVCNPLTPLSSISKAQQTAPNMNSSFYGQELCPVCGISSALNEVLLPLLTVSVLSRAAVCQEVSCIISCFLNDLARAVLATDTLRHCCCNHKPQCIYTDIGCSRNSFTVLLHSFCHKQSLAILNHVY